MIWYECHDSIIQEQMHIPICTIHGSFIASPVNVKKVHTAWMVTPALVVWVTASKRYHGTSAAPGQTAYFHL